MIWSDLWAWRKRKRYIIFWSLGYVFSWHLGSRNLIGLLWNHFNSWGSMFESSQYFPGSCGHNFVGSKVEIILIIKYLTNDCIFVHGDVNMWTKVIHKSHEDWSPMNNYDFWLWYIECLHAKIPIIPFKICFTCKWKNKQMTTFSSSWLNFFNRTDCYTNCQSWVSSLFFYEF